MLSTLKQRTDLIWLVGVRSRPRYQTAEFPSLFYMRSLKEFPAAIPRVMRISCLSTHTVSETNVNGMLAVGALVSQFYY